MDLHICVKTCMGNYMPTCVVYNCIALCKCLSYSIGVLNSRVGTCMIGSYNSYHNILAGFLGVKVTFLLRYLTW